MVYWVIIAWVGLNYTRKTFKKDHVDKPNEEKSHLLAQFKANQTLSKQTYEVAHKFTVYYDAFHREVWPGQGITYQMYLNELKNSHDNGGNLSDAVYEQIKHQEMSSMQIQSHVKSLEQQFEALMLIYQEFRIKTQNL